MRALSFAVTCLLLVGVSPTPSPMPTGAPTVSPMPAPSLTPTPSIAPVPSLTPASSASASPTPFATPTILMLPPDAPPQILWVALSSTTPHAGDTLTVTVLTSSNVASVELRVGGYGGGMQKTDVGHFESTSTVPHLPFFISRNLTLQIIARNTAGVAVQQTVALQVR